MIVVEPLAPAQLAAWDAFVDEHPRSTLYHRRAWMTVAERAYRLRAPFLVARDGAALCGVLPLFVVENLGGGHVASALFGGYADPLGDDAACAALLAEARALGCATRARYLVIKALADRLPDGAFEPRGAPGAIATLPLAADPDAVWRALRDKVRNAVRKARRAGLEVRDDARHLAAFYDVLAENYHRLGTPAYGLPLLRALVDALGARCRVVTVWRDGRVVGGALVARHRGVVYVPFASSRPSALAWCPNNLLYWEIIRRGCLDGDHMLDFGRSPVGSGALAFKLGWGATPRPQPAFVHTLRGAPPGLDPSAPSVRRLIALWRRLPRRAADALGPAICRRFLA